MQKEKCIVRKYGNCSQFCYKYKNNKIYFIKRVININGAPVLTVTYHIFQLCDEKKDQPYEFIEFNCYNDGSGIIFLKFEPKIYISIFVGL